MRHNIATAVTLAAVLLISCAEAQQNESGALLTPDLNSPSVDVERTNQAELPPKYQGLDPKKISRAEIDELIALEASRPKVGPAYEADLEIWHAELKAWATQDISDRGPQPKFNIAALSQDENERLNALRKKLKLAETRKKYEGLDPRHILQTEIDELLALKAARTKADYAHRAEIESWRSQDGFKGPRPKLSPEFFSQDKQDRLRVLDRKLQIAETRERYESYDPKDISQAEIDELIAMLPQAEAHRDSRMWQPTVPEFPQSERFLELISKVQMAEIRRRYEDNFPTGLSEAEVEEAIALEQDQLKDALALQEELQAWIKQDPATRGPKPHINTDKYMSEDYRRLRALHAKIRGIK